MSICTRVCYGLDPSFLVILLVSFVEGVSVGFELTSGTPMWFRRVERRAI
jgi:hypothetical protein